MSEPVSCHVKQKLTRVLSAFHATPVSVPLKDSLVTCLIENLSAGFMQPGPGVDLLCLLYFPHRNHSI